MNKILSKKRLARGYFKILAARAITSPRIMREQTDCTVMARAQRPADAAPCVAATAESLPFEDQSFDAAMAFSTVHHWQDSIAGLREMRRVARRVVVFTFDSSDTGWRRRFWLTRDYLPEVADLLVGRPSLSEQARAIGARMEPVLIPWDCADGFFEAYWRRPAAYLDENVRRGVSVWARVGPDAEQRAVHSLRMTSPQAGGPNATATSSISKQQSLAFACLSPEPATPVACDRFARCTTD
jgi:SAM-dependent methyltransferase